MAVPGHGLSEVSGAFEVVLAVASHVCAVAVCGAVWKGRGGGGSLALHSSIANTQLQILSQMQVLNTCF